MLYIAFALVVLAVACAVVVFGQHTDPRLHFVPTGTEADATAEAWRAAALDAHGQAKRLRRGIASALDTRDQHRRETILRETMVDAWRPEGIRITL